jgi:hypothetical protein
LVFALYETHVRFLSALYLVYLAVAST